MTHWNKLLAVVLSVCLAASSLPLGAVAASPEGDSPAVVTDTGSPPTTEGTVPPTTEGTVPPTTEGTVPPTTEGTVPPTTEGTVPPPTVAAITSTAKAALPGVKAAPVWESFTWVEKGEYLAEGKLVLPGVTPEKQADFAAVTGMLPVAITLPDKSQVAIDHWECPEYQKDTEDNWPLKGSFLFTAVLSQEVTFGETAPKRQVPVELPGTVSMLTTVAAAPFTVTVTRQGEACDTVTYGETFEVHAKRQNTTGMSSLTPPPEKTVTLSVSGQKIAEKTGAAENTDVTFEVDTRTLKQQLPASSYDGQSHTFTLSWTDEGGLNAASKTFALTLNKKPLTGTLAENQSKAYDGTGTFGKLKVDPIGLASGDNVTVTASIADTDPNAGTYTPALVRVHTAGTDMDYYDLGEITMKPVSIAKADPKVSDFIVTAEEVTYDGKVHTPTITVKDGIQGMGNVIVPQYINVPDSGNIIIQVEEGRNYKSAALDSGVVFTVQKAQPTADLFTASNLRPHYNGKLQSPTVTFNGQAADGTKLTGMGNVTVSTNMTKADNVHYPKDIRFSVDDTGSNYTGTGFTADNIPVNLILAECFQVINDYIIKENVDYTRNDSDGHWRSQDVVFTATEGKLLSLGNKADSNWTKTLTFSEEGKKKPVTFYAKDADGRISGSYTTTYDLDKTPPVLDVKLEDSPQGSGQPSSGSPRYTNKPQKLVIDIQEPISAVISGSSRYYVTDQVLDQKDLEALSDNDWRYYRDGAVTIYPEDGRKVTVYGKAMDVARNVGYGYMNGFVIFDASVPAVSGVTNGGTCYVTTKITAEDSNLDSFTVGGAAQPIVGTRAEYTQPAVTAETEVELLAVDKAGNVQKLRYTMQPLTTLTDAAQNLTEENLKTKDRSTLQEHISALEAVDLTNAAQAEKDAVSAALARDQKLMKLIEDGVTAARECIQQVESYDLNTVTQEDQKTLQELTGQMQDLMEKKTLPAELQEALEADAVKAEALLQQIRKAEDAAGTQAIQKTQDVDPGNVKLDQKQDLEQAREDLQKALAENKSNYTPEQVQSLQTALKDTEDSLETIQQVEEVVSQIEELPDPKDVDAGDPALKDAVTEILTDQMKLTAHQQGMVQDAQGSRLTEIQKALFTYKIVEGDKQTWKADTADLTITCSGYHGIFTGLKVDGELLRLGTDYTVKEGSTVATLKASYLETLRLGNHTVAFYYDADGVEHVATGTFQTAGKGWNPKTGDYIRIGLWIGALAVSAAGLGAAAYFLLKKKKK